MNVARKLLSQLSVRANLPGDVLAGLPRMELIGTGEFSVEPHKGLLSYDTDKIILATTAGPVCVIGTALSIRSMNSARISLTGNISGIELLGASDG